MTAQAIKTLVLTTDGKGHITRPISIHEGSAGSAQKQILSKGGDYHGLEYTLALPRTGPTRIAIVGGPTIILAPLPADVEAEGREASYALSLGFTA